MTDDYGHSAKLLAHSITDHGFQLYTWEVRFPRIVLAELNTHRMLSRNSASSRAIPVEKMIRMVMVNPYVPSSWGKNQKGMQAGEDLNEEMSAWARMEWLQARDSAVRRAQELLKLGVHKQLANRLLEPFMWHTAIVSATEVSNLYNLRDNPEAHPDLQQCAHLMKLCAEQSTLTPLKHGEWHLPLIGEDEMVPMRPDTPPGNEVQEAWEDLRKISVGRCARVSYLTHDGKRDLNEDIALHDRLLASGHMSPFEHVARPMTEEEMRVAHRLHFVLRDKATGALFNRDYLPSDRPVRIPDTFDIVDCRDTYFCGNFQGWMQYRKTLPWEHDIKNPRVEVLRGPM